MNNKEEYIKANDEIKASEELKRKTMYRIKQKKTFRFPYKLANAMTIVLVLLCVIFISDNAKVNEIIEPHLEEVKHEMKLPTVGNVKNLYELLDKADNGKQSRSYKYISAEASFLADGASYDTNSANISAKSSSATQMANNDEFSKTNVQVEGVDEADIVKTDGNYIYYISQNKLVIVEAGNSMNIVSEIEYSSNEGENVNPLELFISKNKLVMIASKYKYNNRYKYISNTTACFAIPREQKTIAITYDITNKEKPEVYKEFEIEGNYVSSRMINETVYLVTNNRIYRYSDDTDELKEEDVVQKYKDSTTGAEQYISLSDICYIPDSEENCYLNVIAFDTQNKREANITTILGAGNTIYASNDNIYVTCVKYEFKNEEDTSKNYTKTKICKFNLDRMNVNFVASGEIEGTILNQFSMDEYNGNFRIAVTAGNWNESKNGVYVLDNNLEVIGKVEDLAINERIYAVRFIGKKGYVVTFRNMDPLFVIDLKDATNPYVAGELKIPGYSSYLHPYDENHIIGIGQEVTVERNRYGNEYTSQHGLKLSMFDVSDPENPIEMFNTIIGEGGTYTSASYNHKALLYMKDRNIMAFPINMYKVTDKNLNKIDLDFVGAIVIDIDLEKGFSVRGKIAHMNIENSYKDYKSNLEINRIIYIGNDFYTLSPGMIKRTDIDTMQGKEEIEINVKEEDRFVIIN